MSKCRREHAVVGFLLTVQASLLGYASAIHSPGWDEPGHLASGISHWQFANFRMYHVNPPLARLVAAVPVLAVGCNTVWSGFSDHPYSRPEYLSGRDFVRANRDNAFRLMTYARWACIPFSLLGGIVCWHWARALYGSAAGFVALLLWTFGPNILASGQQISPDMAAISVGLLANYLFWRWLRDPSWRRIPMLGLVFGLAQLTKTTWIILFGLWPLLWAIQAFRQRQNRWPELWQLAACLLLGVFTINLVYGFEGSFTRLGDYTFVSRALAEDFKSESPGNRFRGTLLAHVPVPLPRNYVAGMDVQKYDFDRTMRSYLRGTWQDHGWWHYYLYGLAIKEPLGTWLIVLLALAVPLMRSGYAAPWFDEAALLAPGITVVVLVSAHTGFNHHLRYVLPCLPYFYIWASKLGRSVEMKAWSVAAIGAVALAWATISSLSVYPHSHSFFNELVGGSKGGHWHLGGSNVDWGQDLLLLKRWYDEHPEARPFHLAYELPNINPELAGIRWRRVPTGPVMNRPGAPKTQNWPWPDESEPVLASPSPAHGPAPGWHALSLNQIHWPDGTYEYFLEFEPVAIIGYSTHIYHITLQDANNLRRRLGMAELAASSVPAKVVADD